MNVQNKVVVITGGGNGIGRELVLNFLSKGAKVVAVDINPFALDETKKMAQKGEDQLATIIADITKEEEVNALPEKVIEKMGMVDILINNAGIMHKFYRYYDLEETMAESVININLIGVLRVSRAFLPYLLKRPEGYLVNLSSMASYLPVAGQSIYGLTKAGVKLFTEVLAMELRDTPVKALVVLPGNIDTGITATAGVEIPKEVMGQKNALNTTSPQKVAGKIITAIEKNKSSILVGNDAKIMHFLNRIAPSFAAKLIYKQTRMLLLEKN